MNLTLSFHSSRDQPLSDLVNRGAAHMFLTSRKPIELMLSIMTSRGVAHIDNITLTEKPYDLPYDAPWGVDWSVLQLVAVQPRDAAEDPHEVILTVERS